MTVNRHEWLEAPVIKHATIDSTNNYAMQLIDADKAQPGTTITTLQQTAGKGQRGRTWTDVPGESLLMSIVLLPQCRLDVQFAFSAGIATAIATALKSVIPDAEIAIKWPNDIIINAKKTGGILIENVLRGNDWIYAVAGIGLNIRQQSFSAGLPNAGSLLTATGRLFELEEILNVVRAAIIDEVAAPVTPLVIMERYNAMLFKKGLIQSFEENGILFRAKILAVTQNGELLLERTAGKPDSFRHGTIEWIWS